MLSGFFMKYSDELYDVNHETNLSTFLGIICGFVSVAASIYNADAAYIFISILIGNLIVRWNPPYSRINCLFSSAVHYRDS